ncbi:MAG: hypothetical protein K2X77_03990 [Candidatus Obscuribacterales bacterium]|jgi:hypothetical protein|nr:hypothetical protein [Candidatus Obscuribacterales bacterium]
MSFFRKHLTDVAVDSFTQYLMEKFEKIKQLDLDKDGQKDVDQMMAILENCSVLAKRAIDTTDFQKIAAGIEQMMAGINMVQGAVDGQSLKAIGSEMGVGLQKLGHLASLGIKEVKEKGTLTD